MKKQMILFGLISIFAGSSAAWACDKCSVDLKVYDKILNRGCSLNYQTITNSGAQSIARLAAEGRIDVDAFMDIWNKTCDYDSSLDQAKEVKLGQLNLDVYDRIKGKSCSLNYQTITNSGAR